MANIHPVKFGKRERFSFSRIKDVLDIPNLIEVQKNSYDTFIREGIAEVFKDFSPIQDYSGHFELYFLEHTLDEKSKYTEAECRERDATYASPLKIKVLQSLICGNELNDRLFPAEFHK